MDDPLSFEDYSGDTLAALMSRPDKPNGRGIVLLHCFTCTKHHRIMRTLSEGLTDKGFTVLRFDFSGNGESGGKIEESTYTKMLREVREAVDLLQGKGFRRIGVAGHSMGAMLSALAAHEDKRIKAVGFIAGSSQAARVREIFPDEILEKAERDGSATAFVYGRTLTIRREFLHDVEKYNIGHAAATMRRPFLIVHGTKDEIIHPYHARQLFGWASEPKTLKMIDGADHLFKRPEHLERLRETVSDWFAENL
jgi:esterase/lipase